MGVNAKVRLSNAARWEKVGQVACVLLGATVSKQSLGTSNPNDSYHAVVESFDRRETQDRKVAARLLGEKLHGRFQPTSMPEYIDILVDGDAKNPVLLDLGLSDAIPYPLWYGLEERSLYPKATAAKIALAEGITKFFGGEIVYNDCSGVSAKFPAKKFTGETDAPFYRYQNALLKLKALTQKDIDRCAKYAAY